ncbi:MAG: hypothetical protein KGZ42_03315 [Melioribacter sp.]|nr:hypothetical protein [Melioribacter sp.]
MKKTKSFELGDDLKKKIISVAYGDANILDRVYVLWLARTNKNVKKDLDEVKRTAELVHSMEEQCPDELIARLKLNKYPVPKSKSSILTDFISIIINRPAASVFVTIALLITVVLSIILNRPAKQQYSHTEIQKANEEARYALQLIGNVMTNTKEKLEKEIITEHVVKPIGQGIEIVNKLLIKGETQ